MKATTTRMKTYHVTGVFLQARRPVAVQHWHGKASSLAVAINRAARHMMKRPGIRRIRHKQIEFRVGIAAESVLEGAHHE